MNDNTQLRRARELLAAAYEKDSPDTTLGAHIRSGVDMFWSDQVAINAILAALSEQQAVPDAFRELVEACEAEFCSPESEEFEPDDSALFYPEEDCKITFGMIRRARALIDAQGKTAEQGQPPCEAIRLPAAQPAVPEGWVMVPVEASYQMVEAWRTAPDDWMAAWRATLAVKPEAKG